jgi:metallophosphoesterase superfamily enzyme
MNTTRFSTLVGALIVALGTSTVCYSAPVTPIPSPPPAPTVTPAPLTVFISDLHFGLGKLPDGKWNPLEDFRWSNALKGFLKAISDRTGANTTLVIAGDMFELWQHPDLDCGTGDADRGCKVGEIKTLTETVASAHEEDLRMLGSFANAGHNHLVIIPGNHDAALLVERVRTVVTDKIKANPGRLTFAETGVWASPDGRLVSEHGHQMPNEQINNWKTWPVVTEDFNNEEYLIRPWGEYFVHKLYDRVERDNSLIDNLIPQSDGVSHYKDKQGTLGTAKDIARFLAFNIGQASLKQLGALKIKGGQEGSGNEQPSWNLEDARSKGWSLFETAVPQEFGPDQRVGLNDVAVQEQLNVLLRDHDIISDEEVKSLCDKSAANAAPQPGVCVRERPELLISTLGSLIPGASCRAICSHLKVRSKKYPSMRIFVYGHTHELQCPFPATPKGGIPVIVANTGAFQRLIDDKMFIKAAKESDPSLSPEQGLEKLTLDHDLPACYSAVFVTYQGNRPSATVQNWVMKEEDPQGEFVDAGNARCAKIGNCNPDKRCQ